MDPRALLPLCLLFGACAAPAGEGDRDRDGARVGIAAARIVNGDRSTSAQDATVLIAIGTQGQFCTGALIAPNLVLTARHCVQGVDETATTECAAYTDRIVPSTITIALGIGAVRTTVAATGKETIIDDGADLCSHDIALILLDGDVKGAKLASVRFDPVAKGETTTTVGYGDDGSGTPTNGRFQRSSLTVNAVGPSDSMYTTKQSTQIPFTVHPGEIATGESTCFGDSGGPLFDAQGRIIGVTSRGLDQVCVDRPSIYSGTASHATMIRAAATTAGHPLPEAPGAAAPSSEATGTDGADPADDGSGSSSKSRANSGSGFVPQPNAGCAMTREGAPSNRSKWPVGALILFLGVAAALRRRSTRAALVAARDEQRRRSR